MIKDIHDYRIYGLAIVDILLTIITAHIISQNTNYSFNNILIFLFVISIPLHIYFNINSPILKYLGFRK
jgi:hypothetical protein